MLGNVKTLQCKHKQMTKVPAIPEVLLVWRCGGG